MPLDSHPCRRRTFDRAAPRGTGDVKAGGNYAADLLPLKIAKAEGFGTTLYLDAAEQKYVEEFSVRLSRGPASRSPGERASVSVLSPTHLRWRTARAASLRRSPTSSASQRTARTARRTRAPSFRRLRTRCSCSSQRTAGSTCSLGSSPSTRCALERGTRHRFFFTDTMPFHRYSPFGGSHAPS